MDWRIHLLKRTIGCFIRAQNLAETKQIPAVEVMNLDSEIEFNIEHSPSFVYYGSQDVI